MVLDPRKICNFW